MIYAEIGKTAGFSLDFHLTRKAVLIDLACNTPCHQIRLLVLFSLSPPLFFELFRGHFNPERALNSDILVRELKGDELAIFYVCSTLATTQLVLSFF